MYNLQENVILFLSIMVTVGCAGQSKIQNKNSNLDANVKFVRQITSDTEKPVVAKYVKLYDSLNHIAATSSNKDTLFLPDDSVGRSIQQIWVQYPLKKNPTIVFVQNEDVLIAMIRKQKLTAIDRKIKN